MSLPEQKKYFNYLQSFRGFAVINVVLQHATIIFYFGSSNGYQMQHAIPLLNEVFWHGSTMYFTLISGILFSAVFKQQGYKKFYINKLLYLVVPYVFFATGLTLLKNVYFNPFDIDVSGFLSMLPLDIFCGKSNFALWYIPVFIIICLLTPLLDYLLHKNTLTKTVFCLFILAPLYFSRIRVNDTNYIRIETLMYFIGPYAIGMYCGLDLERTMEIIKKRIFFFVAVALLATAILFYIKYNKILLVGDTIIAESFFYIQKVSLAAILVLFFKQLGEKQPPLLRVISKDSMLTYFMHGYILMITAPLLYFLFEYKQAYPMNIIAAVLILTIATLVICKSVIYLLRKILGQRSKIFLGGS